MKASTAARIDAELARQQELKRRGKFERTCHEMPDIDNLIVVIEELSEVAEEINGPNHRHRDEEIIQVIACLIGWYERPAGEYPARFSNLTAQALRARLIALGRDARAVQEPATQTKRASA